jgi:transcription-repair coupling factor (superfamily II helicase)
LETIREASDLGAGYTIAMRDLELRGAGDILGMRQSGHIASVGFDLYTRLLTRAVQERKAERRGVPPPPQPLDSIKIYLPIPAHLPDDYVPDVGLRLQIYRRVAEMGSLAEIEEMGHELADRFGALPPEAENLLYQLRLKVLARDAGVEAIAVENGRLALRSGVGDYARQAVRKALGRGVAVSRRTLWLPMEDDWREALAEALRALGALR